MSAEQLPGRSRTIPEGMSVEFEKLYLETRRSKGTMAALEQEATQIRKDLATEQRARQKAVYFSRLSYLRFVVSWSLERLVSSPSILLYTPN